jgi:hypothetical protein
MHHEGTRSREKHAKATPSNQCSYIEKSTRDSKWSNFTLSSFSDDQSGSTREPLRIKDKISQRKEKGS